jgi:hypothetical protein
MNRPSWDVVATVDEPAALVIAFAAHYLHLGARKVHLFLDQPNPVAQTVLANMPRLQITVCDRAYWRQYGKRPKLHVWRQRKNAARVFHAADADWLLSLDCDEYLRDGAALERDLAAQGHAIDFMRIPVAERVMPPDLPQQGLFDGIFRRQLQLYRDIGADLYGADAGFYKRGLTGHTIGKSAFRVGRDLDMNIHGPTAQIPNRPDYSPTEGRALQSELLHFDGMTELHYALKLMRRAAEPPSIGTSRHGGARTAQIARMAELAGDVGGVMALAGRLKRLSAAQYTALSATDYLDQAGFDIAPALAALGLNTDLSCAQFDADLRLRDADLIAKTGWGFRGQSAP